jgi:hypothetical protein
MGYFNLLLLLILMGVHVTLVASLRGLKNNVAAGVDFALTGAFLSGYWFGFKWGFILGCIFMLSNFIATMEFWPSMFIMIPMCGFVGIWGALVPIMGIPIMTGIMAGVIGYAIINDFLMFTLFGEKDFIMFVMHFIGAIVINWVFFDLFF